jgi:hypothetical protein
MHGVAGQLLPLLLILLIRLGTAAAATNSDPPPRLSGVFLTAYEQDVPFTLLQWELELDAMQAVGINTILIGETASSTFPNYSLATIFNPPPLHEKRINPREEGERRIRVFTFWPTNIGSTIPGYALAKRCFS